MKCIAAILVLVTASLFVQAQTQLDFFSFLETFDWSLTASEFKTKYADKIQPTPDYAADKFKDAEFDTFFLQGIKVGENNCTCVVAFFSDSDIPIIFASPSFEDLAKNNKSSFTLKAEFDEIATERLGIPDRKRDVNFASVGYEWIGNCQGDLDIWNTDKYSIISYSMKVEEVLVFAFVATIMDNVHATEGPVIQDTFFGIKIGSFTNESDIIAAVGIKGKYLKELRDANSILYVFSDMFFAGYKWDYCSFVCGPDGRLCMFRAIRTFTSNDYNYVDKANDLYNSVKQKLDAKYGEGKKMKAGRKNSITSYSGSNDMVLFLQNEWEPSQSRPYYKCVRIEYSNTVIYNQLKQAGNDEL